MWIKPTSDDVTSALSGAEAQAYSRSSGFSQDVIDSLLARSVALARGFIRAGGGSLSRDASLIPDSLLAPVVDYTVWDLLKRMPIPANETRTKARDAAFELFQSVANGRIKIEEPENPEPEAKTSSALPAFAENRPERRL